MLHHALAHALRCTNHNAAHPLSPTQATVVLKNMFDPTEVQGNKGIIKDLHNDVVEECRKHGTGTPGCVQHS